MGEQQKKLKPGKDVAFKAGPVKLSRAYGDKEAARVKMFLTLLIALSERIHHQMYAPFKDDKGEEELLKMHQQRRTMFEKATGPAKDYINDLELCPMEPWRVYESVLRALLSEEDDEYYEKLNNSGIQAAAENPYLMDLVELDALDHDRRARHSRLSEQDIEELLQRADLSQLKKDFIECRQVNTGEFWDKHYDV